MKKLYLRKQIEEALNLKEYSIEVISNIISGIYVLNENYGAYRNIDTDLGGYAVIAKNIFDMEIMKQDKLQEVMPEYTDIIECSERINWTSSLFLLSSDFEIIVVTTEELSKFLLE